MESYRLSRELSVKNREDLLAQIRQAIRVMTVHEGHYTVRIDFGGTGLKPGHAPDGGGILGEDP